MEEKETGIKAIENTTVIRSPIQKDFCYIVGMLLNVYLEKFISESMDSIYLFQMTM